MSTRFAATTLARARRVRAAVFDVDGVLTDGRLFIDGDGERLKAFHVQDGHGLKLLLAAGIAPLIVTGRDSAAVRRRVADLGLPYAHYGVADKAAAVSALLAELGLSWGELAVIGDDWPDLPLMARAAFSAAPADAHPDVLARVHHVCERSGGRGAAREFADLLLHASGQYPRLLADQTGTLDGR